MQGRGAAITPWPIFALNSTINAIPDSLHYHSMLPLDVNQFVNAARAADHRAREDLLRTTLPLLVSATWEDVQPTGVVEALLELVDEFECTGEVSRIVFV